MTRTPLQGAKAQDSLAELHAQVGSRLAQHGHRYTSGRRELVEILVVAGQPMTLPDVVEAGQHLAQSSAYRNLDVLVRSSVIRRFNAGGDYTYFELAEPLLGHHHHLICTSCGNVEDIHFDSEIEHLVDKSLSEISARTGFIPATHTLDLHGQCADC